MRIGNRDYTRAEILRRVGNVNQVGGTRHTVLAEGRATGIAAIDFDTGAGLRFTVLPDRGMDISAASYKGVNLVYLTPNGEVHPAFYEPEGLGWLHTFFGGLLTTCGLTTLGAPGRDGDEDLGLHGRYAATPGRQVCDRTRWEGDDYILEASAVMEECRLFGDKIRLTRTISAHAGARSLAIRDVVENFGYRPSPFTILYHINFGFPLLDASSRAVVSAAESTPRDARSAQGMDEMLAFSAPVPGCEEQNFSHRMSLDAHGDSYAGLINRELHDGLGVYIRFDGRALPYLNEWKMMGEGDYVAALEPCNAPCDNRGVLRQRGLLPFLAPGETQEIRVEIGVLEGEAEIRAFEQRAAEARG
ncbi:MAG: aldose 1-epimerase family protein [Chloroflexi bacterium]|nr:aldose 1-epimerase family protein [Chloroflexota bacterium]